MRRGIFIFSLCIVVQLTQSIAIAATWARTYARTGISTIAHSVEPTNDGGFLAAGIAFSSLSDFTTYDIFLMKIDSSGTVQWQKTYGGSDRDIGFRFSDRWHYPIFWRR